MFAKAAEVLHKHYGELDDTGEVLDEQAVTLRLGEQEYQMAAIVGDIRYQTTYSPTDGSEKKRMQRTIKVLPGVFEELGISQFPVRMEVSIGDELWSHDVAETQWSKMFVTIGLERTVLSRLNTQERNGGAV